MVTLWSHPLSDIIFWVGLALAVGSGIAWRWRAR